MNQNHAYGVIWDMDGVLVDTGRFHYSSWKHALGKRGIPFSEEQFRKLFGRNNRGTLEVILGRPPTKQEEEEIAHDKEEIFRREVSGQAELLPGVCTLLEAFQQRGYRQAIGSSAPPDNINQLIDELHIKDFFVSIVAGPGYPSKPHPDLFLAAAGKLGVPPSSCLVIEDALAGVEAASRAGMPCLAVATTNPPADLHLANLIVNRLNDVKLPEVFSLLEKNGDPHDA